VAYNASPKGALNVFFLFFLFFLFFFLFMGMVINSSGVWRCEQEKGMWRRFASVGLSGWMTGTTASEARELGA
jgi:hypothetical protein